MNSTDLKFASGATRTLNYVPIYPVVGLDPDGRVIVDMTQEFGQQDGKPYLFGLTLCCNAFDKGGENGIYCRACYGDDDIGSYDPVVVDRTTGLTATEACCDGTGWTGNPSAPCAEHYEPYGGW